MILAALSSPKGAEVDHHPKLHQDEEPNGKEDGHEGKPRNHLNLKVNCIKAEEKEFKQINIFALNGKPQNHHGGNSLPGDERPKAFYRCVCQDLRHLERNMELEEEKSIFVESTILTDSKTPKSVAVVTILAARSQTVLRASRTRVCAIA